MLSYLYISVFILKKKHEIHFHRRKIFHIYQNDSCMKNRILNRQQTIKTHKKKSRTRICKTSTYYSSNVLFKWGV